MKAKVIKTGEIVDVYHEPQHGQVTNIYKESVLVNSRMWSEDELDFCMKATELPEKIYVHKSQYWGLMSNSQKITKDDIEYTRVDDFIVKAWEWFEDNMLSSNQQDKSRLYFEQFKNYMKGE